MGSNVDARLLSKAELDVALNLTPAGPNPSLTGYSPQDEPHGATSGTPNVNARQQKEGLKEVRTKNNSGGLNSDSLRVGMAAKSADRAGTTKSKRVRTGCLTCRERHLKCDEAAPRCQNCQKSDRQCKRGIRLNFIDTQVTAPPYIVPYLHDRQTGFQDESREIASEYQGGFERYPTVRQDLPSRNQFTPFDFTDVLGAPTMSRQTLPAACPILPTFSEPPQPEIVDPIFQPNPQAAPPSSSFSQNSIPHSSLSDQQQTMVASAAVRPYLNDAEEVLLMQVFVEEVGVWMDSMDEMKHVRMQCEWVKTDNVADMSSSHIFSPSMRLESQCS